jgi:adenylylsulfate kinase
MKFKETKERSVTKAVTFRVLIICADLAVIYLLTKRIDTTIALTILTNLVSTFFYFLHERFWNNIAWGRQRAS